MTNRLELNWKLDGFVDEQRYYCSETQFTAETKPAPKLVLANGVRTYVDANVEIDKTYYVAIGSVKNNVEKFSEIKEISTKSLNTVLLMHFNNDFINVVTSEVATVDGSVPFVAGLFGSGVSFGLSASNINQLRFLNTNGRFNLPGMFTVEGYIKHTATIGAYRNVFLGGSSANPGGLALVVTNGRLVVGSMYVADLLTSNKVMTQNEAIRFAITRDEDSVLRLFINGVLDSEVVTSNTFSFSDTGSFYIGNHPNGGGGAGVIDEFRIIKDQCLYKENYVLSDTEFAL